jgi:hypothetical protein
VISTEHEMFEPVFKKALPEERCQNERTGVGQSGDGRAMGGADEECFHQ